jgi:hypothetical protein
MGDFNVQASRGWRLVMAMTNGDDLPALGLLRIAQILSVISSIRLPRDMQRRRGLIVKWIDDNFESFVPYVTIIRIAPGFHPH